MQFVLSSLLDMLWTKRKNMSVSDSNLLGILTC